MTSVASRDLRNHTADLLREVAAGRHVTITVHGEAVAELVPAHRHRRRTVTKRDLIAFLQTGLADPALGQLLDELAGETTDDLA